MKYSLNWLTSKIKLDFKPGYLFFWGHTAKDKNVVDKSCFSQWWPSPFTVDGASYATAEHWMMEKKALLFQDEEQQKNIMSTDSPASAKKFGRAVKNFDAVVWESKAFEFAIEGNLHKFSQNAALRDFLINTGELIIVEASPFDKIWGIGTQAHETDPFKWKGNNLLGFALMEVRDLLKNNDGKST